MIKPTYQRLCYAGKDGVREKSDAAKGDRSLVSATVKATMAETRTEKAAVVVTLKMLGTAVPSHCQLQAIALPRKKRRGWCRCRIAAPPGGIRSSQQR